MRCRTCGKPGPEYCSEECRKTDPKVKKLKGEWDEISVHSIPEHEFPKKGRKI